MMRWKLSFPSFSQIRVCLVTFAWWDRRPSGAVRREISNLSIKPCLPTYVLPTPSQIELHTYLCRVSRVVEFCSKSSMHDIVHSFKIAFKTRGTYLKTDFKKKFNLYLIYFFVPRLLEITIFIVLVKIFLHFMHCSFFLWQMKPWTGI